MDSLLIEENAFEVKDPFKRSNAKLCLLCILSWVKIGSKTLKETINKGLSDYLEI